jgi:hypothetical protein
MYLLQRSNKYASTGMYADDERERMDLARSVASSGGAGGFPMRSVPAEERFHQVDVDGNDMASDDSDVARMFESRPKQSTTTARRRYNKPGAKQAARPAQRRPQPATKRPIDVSDAQFDVSQARMMAMAPRAGAAPSAEGRPVPPARRAEEMVEGEAAEARPEPHGDDAHFYGEGGAEPPGGEAIPEPPIPRPVSSTDVEKLRKYPREAGKTYKCFGCLYARNASVNPVSGDRIAEMGEIVGGAPPASWVEVALDVHEYYEREFLGELNSRLQEGEEQFPEWHVQDIYDHYFTCKHNKADVQFSTHSRIVKFERILEEMYDEQTWQETTWPDGRVCRGIRTENVDLMIRIGKYIDMMYARTVTGKSGIGSVAQTNLTRAPGVVRGGIAQYYHPRQMSIGRR